MELDILITIVVAGVVGVVGFLVGIIVKKQVEKGKLGTAEDRVKQIIVDAENKAGTIKKEAELEAKDILLKSKIQFENESQEKQKELQTLERRLISREENLEKKFDLLENKDSDLKKQDQSLIDRKKHTEALEKKYHQMIEETKTRLEKIAGISSEDAKNS